MTKGVEYEGRKGSEQIQENKKSKGEDEAEEDEKNGKGKWRKKKVKSSRAEKRGLLHF